MRLGPQKNSSIGICVTKEICLWSFKGATRRTHQVYNLDHYLIQKEKSKISLGCVWNGTVKLCEIFYTKKLPENDNN